MVPYMCFHPLFICPIPTALYHPARIQVDISLIYLFLQEGDIVEKQGDIVEKQGDIVVTMVRSCGLL